MAALEDLRYLQPGFDLNSLTMPDLRIILVSHDVTYPSSAKKAQLIQLVEERILPRAKKLLRDRERVRRTSAGITDMSNESQSTTNEDEEEDSDAGGGRDSMPPPPTPSTTTSTRRGRSSRQSTRASTADTEESTLTTPRRRPGRPSKHPRASDTETGDEVAGSGLSTINESSPRKKPSTTARKSRKSEAIPTTEVESHTTTPRVKTESRETSVFTDDNPFQSGSSPAPEDETPRARTVSSERKRKSTPLLSSERRSLVKDDRFKRKSEQAQNIKQEDNVVVPSRATFEFPVSRLRTSTPKAEESGEDDADVRTGEEFTPDEQLALESEIDRTGQGRALRRRSRKPGKIARASPWIVIFSCLAGFGGYWRHEKLEIGFCGVGKPSWSLDEAWSRAEITPPKWANYLEPQCEPCPPHAFCYQDLQIECEKDFIAKPHPLSLNGLVPLPPTCEPDSEKSRRIKVVADKAVEELRERRAQYECGDSAQVKSPAVSEEDLKQAVAKKRRRGMTDEEFEDLWKGAIGELVVREEITTQRKTTTSARHLSSNSLARLPISCAARRYIRLSLLAYRLHFSIVAMFLLTLLYARSLVLARVADRSRVPELVATTLDRLSTQAALYARGDAQEPYISIGQLRDDVLRTELHGKRRERLWKRVQAVVEGNANVRASVREGRGGDVSRVWEWIGGIGNHQIEGHSRRESGRVRFSLSPGGEIAAGEGDSDDKTLIHNSSRESRKWDEGRPIY